MSLSLLYQSPVTLSRISMSETALITYNKWHNHTQVCQLDQDHKKIVFSVEMLNYCDQPGRKTRLVHRFANKKIADITTLRLNKSFKVFNQNTPGKFIKNSNNVVKISCKLDCIVIIVLRYLVVATCPSSIFITGLPVN